MTPSRTFVLAAAAVSLVVTAGCSVEKPTPTVTVYNGGTSVHSAATAYCFDESKNLVQGGCREQSPPVQTIRVRAGDRIGVNVGSEIENTGWIAALGNQQLTNLETKSAALITVGALEGGSGQLNIFKVREVAGNRLVPVGRWTFTLQQAT